MSELAPYTQQLPTHIEDLAQFLLVAPEKAKAVKAEIQAIKNLGLATEVYDQKLEEQRWLAELILDASVKVGEFTRTLPKKERMRTDLLPDSAVGQTKTVHELGSSPKDEFGFARALPKSPGASTDIAPTESTVARLPKQEAVTVRTTHVCTARQFP